MADDKDTEGVILALQQMTKDLDAFHKKAREVSSPSAGFKQLDTIFSTLSKTMLYSGGLAAAFYGVAKSLESVAQASVQLKAFANNTGFATAQVQNMQQGMRRMGMSAQEAQGQIAAFGDKLNNLMAFKEASDLWQNLSKSEGGAALANRMKDLVRVGNQMGAVSEYIRVFNLQTREGKIAMAQYAGMSIDTLENLATRMSRNVPIFQKSKEEMQKYHDMWVDLETRLNNIWGRISDKGIEHVNQMTEFLKAQGVNQNSIVKFIDEEITKTFRSIKDTVEEIKKIKEWYDNLFGKTYNQAEDPMGKDYQRGDHKPINSWSGEPATKSFWQRMFGGSSAEASTGPGELIRVENDSNSLLRDVRDSLQRMETGGGIPGEAGNTGYPTGQARRSLSDRLGINTSSSGARSDNNKTVSNDVPPPVSDEPHSSASIIRRGAEGGSGSGSGLPQGRGNAVPSSILAEARGVARLGGAGAVQQYIRSKGYHVDANWCGDFAAAVVRGAGGTPPKGYPVASNWRNWGTPVEGDPQPGDVAIRKMGRGGYVPTGSTGSHVNIVDDYQHGAGRFRAIGGNQSRTIGNFSRSAFDFRRGDASRQREVMDQNQSGSSNGAFGKINASVEFLNVPNGVRTKAGSEGDIFQQLQIGKTKQAGVYDEPFVGY